MWEPHDKPFFCGSRDRLGAKRTTRQLPPGILRGLCLSAYSGRTCSATGRENDRKIKIPTATAALSIITRIYCAMGSAISPKTDRISPKLALQVQRAK